VRVFKNLRFAWRVLRKNPGFTTVAVCSLAIGIGANSAIFSIADALLLRPLPVFKPSQVANIVSNSPTTGNSQVSYPDYKDFRDRSRSFDGMLAYCLSSFGFSQNKDQTPEIKYGFFVSANFFKVLGVEPTLGRGFRPDEDQVAKRDAVVVLSHDLWASSFGSDPSVIGRKIRLTGSDYTVIGVAPEHFTGVDQYLRPALYVPLAMAPAIGWTDVLENRNNHWLIVKGRLKPGVTTAQAQADLAAIAHVLQKAYPDSNRSVTARVETELQMRIRQDPPDAQLLSMLMVLAGCVLLVACANVAGLLLSRARGRSREVAIRLAIGAKRKQLIAQLLLESFLIALLGGLAGTVIAYGGAKFFSRLQIPGDLPIVIAVHLDRRVLLFTLLASFASTLLFGLAPAFRTTKADLVPSLKAADADAGRRRRLWGRNLLVVGQIAVSLILLTVSGLIFRGFRAELDKGPGYRIDHLLMMSFNPSAIQYNDSQARQFYKQLLEKARATPGVKSAALTLLVPLQPAQHSETIVPEGRQLRPGQQNISVFGDIAGENYFETVGINILRGRSILESDTDASPRVAVVNQQFASHFWPNQDAIGKRFHLDNASGPLVQIVGITKTVKYVWIGEAPTDFIYLPLAQRPRQELTLLAQSDSDLPSLATALRREVRELDPNMPIFDVRPMGDYFEMRAVKTTTLIAQTIGTMGLMGLVLALVGLYGLVAYSVSRRTREIGLRMAIGANRSDVLRMVLRQGLTLALIGVCIGLAGSIGADRLVRWMFHGTHADVPTFIVMVVVQIVVALLATYAPARRASLIDPMRALRDE